MGKARENAIEPELQDFQEMLFLGSWKNWWTLWLNQEKLQKKVDVMGCVADVWRLSWGTSLGDISGVLFGEFWASISRESPMICPLVI